MSTINPNCDGSGPCQHGEVRKLPLGSDPHHGNIILCRFCYEREIKYRKDRNLILGVDYKFDLPTWESLEVYKS